MIRPDRPVNPSGGELDRLGFGPLARRLAEVLVSDASNDGLVLGLEGSWGSGKSSLMRIMKQVLDTEYPKQAEVIDFRPWLIGSRDNLLATLFADLRRAVDAIGTAENDFRSKNQSDARKAAKRLSEFAARLEPVGQVAEAVGTVLPGVALVGKASKGLASASKAMAKAPPLPELKEELD